MLISEKLILKLLFLPLLFTGSLWSCDEEDKEKVKPEWKTMTVTASAYNSLKVQGIGDPKITAWGDTLTPGVKSIAVSRDLIKQGLTYRTPVKIEGMEGIFIVNDKMHARWKNKIDIYMGIDRKKALDWGKREVRISFPVEK